MTMIERTGYAVLKRTVGSKVADRASFLYRDRVQPGMEAVTYGIDRRGRQSRNRLEALRDRYAGERCFIIGNGPSLNRMDLSVLRNEKTFALNRGYLLFERIGAPTTFLVAVNRYVVEQFGDELHAAETTRFVSWRSRRWVSDGTDAIFVRRGRLYSFSTDVAARGAWEGATVTYVALQLAYHLGFTEVILIGVDHSFGTSGPANKLVTASEPDSSHFDPSYFGPGIKWQLPDLETSEVAYGLARHQYEAAGRSIVDATIGGRLKVFPKANLVELGLASN